MAKIYHAEIFGSREAKYNWLNKNDIKKVKWKKCAPISEFYLFIPSDNKLLNQYNEFPKITEIFPVNSVGIVTARDHLTIQFTSEELWKAVRNFTNLNPELARATYSLGKDVRDWKVEWAQKDLKESGLDKNKIVKINYRPFDIRYTYFTGNSRGFHCMPRGDLMYHLLQENQGICIGRQGSVIGSNLYDIVFISDSIVDFNLFRRGGELVFPLYIYVKSFAKKKAKFTQLFIFEPEEEYQAVLPNISKEIISSLSGIYKKHFYDPLDGVRKDEEGEKVDSKKLKGFGSKEIFYYIYAVLYSNTYRTKYAEFLKIDFPRIPFTSNYKLFIKLGKLGKQLADLHLLKSDELNKPISKFSGKGDNKVTQRPKYENEKVYINSNQYFTNIKEKSGSIR
jgi:predicted helicase